MFILSIDTSCDETSVAVTSGRRILANEIYSQILIHKKWGGVVPHLAKRAHEERIDLVIEEALKKSIVKNKNLFGRKGENFIPKAFERIDYIGVTYGPGLAPALEVGIRKAKELAKKFNKKIIPVNHMEGHIYSCFAQNSRGNPARPFNFPYLALLVSGGHTELVRFDNHLVYTILGETLDDAVGEALDKVAKLMGLGYPGGPVLERLARDGDQSYHKFPRPMKGSKDLNFSYAGLKTSFFYHFKKLKQKERLNRINDLAASFQEAAFDSLCIKLERAMRQTGIKRILLAGGVAANLHLRKKARKLVKAMDGEVRFPAYKNLCGDNAAMIGIVAYYKAKEDVIVEDVARFDRVPRLRLNSTK